jgi:hypothetical protein
VSGDRHHFIQASLLGGFGETSVGKKQRDADIALRRRGSATTESTTPDQVGWEDKLYRLLNAGPGVDPDAVDKAWTPLENGTAAPSRSWRSTPRTRRTSRGSSATSAPPECTTPDSGTR